MSSKDKHICCICYDSNLDVLIYQSKATLGKLSNEIVKARFYGYSCDKRAVAKMDLLQNYLNVLEDENRKIVLGGKPCLDCYDMQSLAERVRKITTSCDINGRKDITVDESGVDAWLISNPYCVSRERWERIAYIICEAVKLDITIVDSTEDCDLDVEVMTVEQVCDITFEIVRNIIPCDIMVALSVHKEMCDIGLTIVRTEEECKLDFNILVSEVECNIDFEFYKKLIDCNLSFDIIKAVYDNNCSFTLGDPVTLVTPLNKYPISSLNFKGKPDIKALKKLGVNVEKSKYYKDPKLFVSKLKQDYRG